MDWRVGRLRPQVIRDDDYVIGIFAELRFEPLRVETCHSMWGVRC